MGINLISNRVVVGPGLRRHTGASLALAISSATSLITVVRTNNGRVSSSLVFSYVVTNRRIGGRIIGFVGNVITRVNGPGFRFRSGSPSPMLFTRVRRFYVRSIGGTLSASSGLIHSTTLLPVDGTLRRGCSTRFRNRRTGVSRVLCLVRGRIMED